MFLAPDREAALIYLLFFGYYPALFGLLARIRKRPARVLSKLLVFNAACIAEALLALYMLGVPLESISFLGPFTPLFLLVLANLVFLVYDFALAGLISAYFQRLHPRLGKILRGGR